MDRGPRLPSACYWKYHVPINVCQDCVLKLTQVTSSIKTLTSGVRMLWNSRVYEA